MLTVVGHGHWKEVENRRKFFEDFAVQNQFNPLQPENWYSVPTVTILKSKVGRFIYAVDLVFGREAVLYYPNMALLLRRCRAFFRK